MFFVLCVWVDSRLIVVGIKLPGGRAVDGHLGGESLSFLELPLIELVAPLEGVVVVEGSSS